MTSSASPILLLNGASGEPVSAELRHDIGQIELEDWEQHWRPCLVEHVRSLAARSVPRQDWPQQLHWNWRSKANPAEMLLAQRGFAIRCDNMTEGLMLVSLLSEARSQSQRGKPLVYIDYLEAAPWNQSRIQQPPRYRGVGSVLMAAAISLSLDEGFAGRVGLHALPQADDFYRDHCRMSDLGPDGAKQSLRYFEMTPEQAQEFLQ